jgi:hypothetical protein
MWAKAQPQGATAFIAASRVRRFARKRVMECDKKSCPEEAQVQLREKAEPS